MRKLSPALIGLFMAFSCALHAASWSPNTRIESVQVMDGLGIVRLLVLRNSPVFNPADCADLDYIDILLDAPERSAEEQRQLLNAINMAFITRRQAAFLLRDDPADPASCSTIGTSSSIRTATGVRVTY